MTDTIIESPVWPVNELGEIILVQGVGTQTVAGYLPTDSVPVNVDQQLVVALPPFTPWSNTEWQAPVLEDGWVNIPTFLATQYRKVNDEVQVRLSLQNGTSLKLFNLPAGYRPSAIASVVTQVHDNTNAPDYGHLRIEPDGDVMFEHHGTLNGHKIYATFSFWTS